MLAAALTSAAGAQTPPAGRAPVFTPADVFALSQATDVQISPDGRRVAYVRSSGDIMTDKARGSIWLVDVAGGSQSPLPAEDASSPRWSPDGSRIAYLAADSSGRSQIYVLWLANGARAAITDVPETPSQIAWSPDGRRIAFSQFVPEVPATLGERPPKPEGATWADPLKVVTAVTFRSDEEGALRAGHRHLFTVLADGAAPRQLTFGAWDDDGPVSWSPDGQSLFFSSNHHDNRERETLDTDVFEVRLADGALTQLTHRNGPDESPTISPDGRLVAYVGFDDRRLGYQNTGLYVMNRDGSGSRRLAASLDRSVEGPHWSADSKSVFVDYADRGVTRIARIGLDGRLTPIAEGLAGGGLDRPYAGGSFSVSNGGVVAFGQGDADHPPDVAVAAQGAAPRRLTRLNDDLFAGKTLGQLSAHTARSRAGGLSIDYWMIAPPGYDANRKYPAILEIHGGPFAAYGPIWSTDDQLYAAAGYVVLYANPRGSTSYGEAFADEIHHNYPSRDFDDLMSVVDDAVARGGIDADNLFVTGGSGGGLLTAWIVGKTDRFKAAASQKPVINWASEVLTTDGYVTMSKYWFGKAPWEDPQGYWARSPLSLVGNIKTPTLVMVGESDHRTPDDEAEQFYAALQLREVPTALVYAPGASHGAFAERPSQLIAENAAILAWFARYRTDKPR